VRSNRGQKPGMSASRDQADETRRVELPEEETGPVPVSIAYAEPRWFGVPPPLALLSLACGSFAVGIVLFAAGHWPYGLILLGITALLLAAFLEIARRRPDSALARVSGRAAVEARDRTTSAFERLRARSTAAAELQRIRSARAIVQSERRALLFRLGEAVHLDDQAAAGAARSRLHELDGLEADLQARLERKLAETEERIRRARLSVQETMLVPPGGEGTPPRPEPRADSGRPAA
jgi:hypothetical protein